MNSLMPFWSKVPSLVRIAQQFVVHVAHKGPVAPLLQIADGPIVLIADDEQGGSEEKGE